MEEVIFMLMILSFLLIVELKLKMFGSLQTKKRSISSTVGSFRLLGVRDDDYDEHDHDDEDEDDDDAYSFLCCNL